MPKVTVKIDPSECILAANCVGIEPKLFQIGQPSHVSGVHPPRRTSTSGACRLGRRRPRPQPQGAAGVLDLVEDQR